MQARVVCAILLLSCPAVHAAAPAQRIAEDVAVALETHPALTIFDDVHADVQEGTVTLAGKVTADYKRQDVARAARQVDGVRQVRNLIEILPQSPSDDDLRYRVARAIYTNAAFWTYASMPRPPIHVIVEHGRVTLTGVVASDAERALARSLATGVGELSVRNELRTRGEAAAHVRRASGTGAPIPR